MSEASVARRESRWVVAVWTLLYAVLLAWGMRLHTFWRDEGEAWIVARDSHGLRSLLQNVRYEGHPVGWYAVLYGITRFTWNPEWMKLPNYLFAVAAAVIILSATRVALSVRLGLVFSYFILFEYGVIDRVYMMGIMLLLVALLLMKSGKGVFRVPVALSLAAFTSLPALIVAVCFYPLHLLPVVSAEGGRRVSDWWRALGVRRALAAGLFAVCVLVAVAEVRPPADSGLLLDSPPSQGAALTRVMPFYDIAQSYLPVPNFQVRFWNSVAISPLHFALVGMMLAVGLLFFFRHRAVRVFFVGTSLLLLMEMMISRRTSARHVGWLFLVFMLALLLQEVEWFRVKAPADGRWRVWRSALLYSVLLTQVATGAFAIAMSMRHRFSGSKQVAQFLRDQGLAGQPMIFAPDYQGLAVLAYLQRPSAYYVEQNGLGSIVVYNKREFYGRRVPDRSDLLSASQNGQRPVLITEKPLAEAKMAELGVKERGRFPGEISADRYFVYW